PSVIGTDYRALRRMSERKCDLPVITVDTTGMELYDVGASKAYRALFDRFATDSLPVEPGRIGYLGANPLDLSCIPPAEMSLTLEDVRQAAANEKNVVVAPSGLPTAKLLQERFGTPYEVFDPLVDELTKAAGLDGPALVEGKRVLVVAQQVRANTIRERLRALGAAQVDCATWFMRVSELAEAGDVRLTEEDDFEELVRDGGYELLVGDPALWPIARDYAGATVDLPDFALSGKLV
ncbi:MAG: hypothetical protein Q4B54_13925, partial [Coriobacteriales bacterium]|nr:hypothetical protein [Coriobacteriales bacterium]